MTYYKITLPNDEIKYINSNNFVWYSKKLNTFIGGDEHRAEYIIIDDEVYRVSWLKYEPKETRGLYPSVSAQYTTQEEYEEYYKNLNKEE